jgi:hypothetical protein
MAMDGSSDLDGSRTGVAHGAVQIHCLRIPTVSALALNALPEFHALGQKTLPSLVGTAILTTTLTNPHSAVPNQNT